MKRSLSSIYGSLIALTCLCASSPLYAVVPTVWQCAPGSAGSFSNVAPGNGPGAGPVAAANTLIIPTAQTNTNVAGTGTCTLASTISSAWYTRSLVNGAYTWVTLQSLGMGVQTPVVTGSAITLTWTAPTQNTDASALTDLAGFKVYRATAPFTDASAALLIGSPGAGASSYDDTNLAPGTYYWAVSALSNAGNESGLSGLLSAILVSRAPPTTPVAPGAGSIVCKTPPGGTMSCTIPAQ